MRLLLILVATAYSSCVAIAQQERPSTADQSRTSPKSREDIPLGSPEQEMIKRVEIKQEEALHKENLERARENAQIGAELRSAFVNNKALNSADMKKLSRMEKLIRRIRSAAGGSDDEETVKDLPPNLDVTLEQLAAGAEELHKRVEKTPRLVISANVIERTNKLLGLIRHIRSFNQ